MPRTQEKGAVFSTRGDSISTVVWSRRDFSVVSCGGFDCFARSGNLVARLFGTEMEVMIAVE